jgi:hypothetical protein
LSRKIPDLYESECVMTSVQLKVVIAGLDPWAFSPRSRSVSIPACATAAGGGGNRVDTRVKPAHDDLRLVLLETEQPVSVPRTGPRQRGEGRGERLSDLSSDWRHCIGQRELWRIRGFRRSRPRCAVPGSRYHCSQPRAAPPRCARRRQEPAAASLFPGRRPRTGC